MVGGASSEYQSVVIELKALEDVLQHLRALEPTEDNLHHINAIRCMALACQLPLQDFLATIEKYESSLGPWSRRTALGSASHKVKWALSITEQVEKFRALVAAKNISINVLLATHSSQTLSTMNARMKQERKDLHYKISEHRTKLEQVQASIDNLEGNISQKTAAVCERLETISEKANATQLSILSMRYLRDQIMAYITTFPKEGIELLKTVIKNNAQIYQTLIQIQHSVSRAPSSTQASNLRFTNVLGEYRELPYEYFCQWEAFEGFLKAQFKGKPGERKVFDGLYHIVNIADNMKSVIKREHWSRAISEGARLEMSMVMSAIRSNSASCPRPGCTGSVVNVCIVSNVCVCNLCHLNFFLTSDKIEDSLGRVSLLEDDESVAQKQVWEDIHIFGSRPEPAEFAEIDKENGLYESQLLRKQSTTALEHGINSHTQVRTKLDSRQPYSVTAIDWNNGASHLDAWLNQSAIPAAAPAFKEQQGEKENPPASSNIPNAAQEIEEIKVFRNVHISSASDPVIDERNLESADELADELAKSELDTQIYYRNIVDRYPLLPSYLALRLARANRHRAERLRQSKVNRDISHTFHPNQPKLSDAPVLLPQSPKARVLGGPDKSTQQKYKCKVCEKRIFRPSSLKTHMYSHTGEKPYLCEFEGCGRRFSIISNLRRHYRKVHKNHAELASNLGHSTVEVDPERSQLHTTKLQVLETDPERSQTYMTGSDFWTNRSTVSRRNSVDSLSSSMNSSLHGKVTFDPQEQEPAFRDSYSRSSVDFSDSPRGLPPPPEEIGKKHSFECDICGNTIRVDRRLEWQRHVLADLQPYTCTVKTCRVADRLYGSRAAFGRHENLQHTQLSPNVDPDTHVDPRCLFCNEHIGFRQIARGRHVGRHMEEIAFAIVTKPYEEWDFYSGSSL